MSENGLHRVPVMKSALEQIQETHRAMTTDCVNADCAFGECEHDEEECPTFEFTYCAACNEIAEWINPNYAEDPGLGEQVKYPCATRKLADAGLAGGERG